MDFLKNDKYPSPLHKVSAFFGHGDIAVGPIGRKLQWLFDKLTGEERPLSMGSLSVVLVALIHIWVGLWLYNSVAPSKTEPQPSVIEVSLVALPDLQPGAAAAPPAAKNEEKKPTLPKKVKTKPLPKKKAPVIPKKVKQPKPQPKQVTEEAASTTEQSNTTQTSQTSESSAKNVTAKPNPVHSNGQTGGLSANKAGGGDRVTCVYCPQIKYPPIALRRNLQGSVMVRIKLSPDGLVQEVTIARSSGHEALDEAAITNVKKWRFVPGAPGTIRQATQPIIFKF